MRRALVVLSFLAAISSACTGIFVVDQSPSARSGQRIDVTVTLFAVELATDRAVTCVEVPTGWTVPELRFVFEQRDAQGRPVAGSVFSGAGVSDPAAAIQAARLAPPVAATWRCWRGPAGDHGTLAAGQVHLSLQVPTGASGRRRLRYVTGRNDGQDVALHEVVTRVVAVDSSNPFLHDARPAVGAFVPSGSLRDVEWLDDRFVAVGAPGVVLTSTDGMGWLRAATVDQQSLTAVAFDPGGRWVVTASTALWAGAALTSLSLEHRVSGGTLSGVAFGAGRFVAVGSSVAASWTGSTGWQERGLAGASGAVAVAYGNQRFVAVGSDRAWVSADGIAWTPHSLPSGGGVATAVEFADGRFVALQAGGVALTSTDGASWAQELLPGARDLRGLDHGAGRWVAVGSDPAFERDVSTWVARPSGSGLRLVDVAAGGGAFVAIGGDRGGALFFGVPRVRVTSGVSDLGRLVVGDQATGDLTIHNDGPGRLTLGRVRASGARDFSVARDACSFTVIGQGASCSVGVTFSPSVTGTRAASLSVATNDPSTSTLTVSMMGAGLIAFPQVRVVDSDAAPDDLDYDFGGVSIGDNRVTEVLIGNTGQADMYVLSLATVDPVDPPFEIDRGTCAPTATVSPGRACVFGIRFTPPAAGRFTESIEIQTSDPDEPSLTLALSGEGFDGSLGPDIEIRHSLASGNREVVDFGSSVVGERRTALITVSNVGTADLRLGRTEVGADSTAFSVARDTCSTSTVAASGSCVLEVAFAPEAVGEFSERITLRSNDPDEPRARVVLRGVGVTPPDPNAGNKPPSSPVLLSPENGATQVATSVELTWERSVDPDGDLVSYLVTVCERGDFSGCEPTTVSTAVSGLSIPPPSAGLSLALLGLLGVMCVPVPRRRLQLALLMASVLALSGCPRSAAQSFEVKGLDRGKSYFWQVVAIDGKGGAAGSEVRRFTTRS